jgi:hypothetical protein
MASALPTASRLHPFACQQLSVFVIQFAATGDVKKCCWGLKDRYRFEFCSALCFFAAVIGALVG